MRQGQIFGIFTYLMAIAFCKKTAVTLPPIGNYGTTRRNRVLNESFQRNRTHVRESSHTNSPDSFKVLVFNSDPHGDFSRCSTAAFSWFLFPSNVGFIDLHRSCQPVTARPHHRTAKLVKPLPSCLVAPKSKRSLQAKGVGTILLAGYMPHRPKPKGQGTSNAVKNSACCHRCLPVAYPAMPESTGCRPRIAITTLRANKPIRPAQFSQVPEAVFLAGKLRLEFRQRFWVDFLFHQAGYYM